MMDQPFWRTKALTDMTREEWESLCDGCARCCLVKLEDAHSGEISPTDVACRLLDLESCRCTNYPARMRLVSDCISLSTDNIDALSWLPPTCGYRLIAEGKDLYWWHPLVSGDSETVHQAGISVRGRVVSEDRVPDSELEDHAVDWPTEDWHG